MHNEQTRLDPIASVEKLVNFCAKMKFATRVIANVSITKSTYPDSSIQKPIISPWLLVNWAFTSMPFPTVVYQSVVNNAPKMFWNTKIFTWCFTKGADFAVIF